MQELLSSGAGGGGVLGQNMGIEITEATPERVRGRFTAEKRVQQPFGLVHGGAYMAFAESMASVATFMAVQIALYLASLAFFTAAMPGLLSQPAVMTSSPNASRVPLVGGGP